MTVMTASNVSISILSKGMTVMTASMTYHKSSNKDWDSFRGWASDSSRGRGRYGQIKAGPRIQARGEKKGTGSLFYCSIPASVHQHKADITI